jgi:NADH-ubiquinone oxidoreductase chain 1
MGFLLFSVLHFINFFTCPLSLVRFISCLAETNRTPFGFAEGESEFVYGFSIEYGVGGFVLIFWHEYASILFMRLLFCVIFGVRFRFFRFFTFR